MKYFKGHVIVFLYVVLVVISTFISAFIAQWLNISDASTILALIQTVLAILVFIPTIFAFVQQLLSLQVFPELDLEWLNESKKLKIPTRNVATRIISPYINNTGNAVTPWFMVRIFIPTDLIKSLQETEDDQSLLDIELKPSIGKDENWNMFLYNNHGEESLVYTFLSNGQYASYPDDKLELGVIRIKLYPNKVYRTSYKIKYTITNDKGPKKNGEFVLQLEKELNTIGTTPEKLIEQLMYSPVE